MACLDTIRAWKLYQKGWKLYQLDVKSTLLKEEVYVEQPQGFEIEGQEEKVYRLKKTLYEHTEM